MLTPPTPSLPIEAQEMLNDPETMLILKKSFLDKHTERKGLIEKFEKQISRIEAREIDDFGKWFLKEFVSGVWEERIGELTRILNNLRIAIIKTDKKFSVERKGYENWQERIEEARRFPMVELVSQFTPLKRSASRFVACCPFHAEKSASFTVYPATNTAHCFGCGWSGDSIKFLMDSRQMNFREAVSKLSF